MIFFVAFTHVECLRFFFMGSLYYSVSVPDVET